MCKKYVILMENNELWSEKVFCSEKEAYVYLINTFNELHMEDTIELLKRIENGNVKVAEAVLKINKQGD